jgi:hypothetical protein
MSSFTAKNAIATDAKFQLISACFGMLIAVQLPWQMKKDWKKRRSRKWIDQSGKKGGEQVNVTGEEKAKGKKKILIMAQSFAGGMKMKERNKMNENVKKDTSTAAEKVQTWRELKKQKKRLHILKPILKESWIWMRRSWKYLAKTKAYYGEAKIVWSINMPMLWLLMHWLTA